MQHTQLVSDLHSSSPRSPSAAKLEKRLAQEDREIPEIPLVIPDPPSPVLVGVPAADGSFTLLMGGWDAGWVHTASFREPRPAAVRVPGAEEVGVSFRTFRWGD